MISKSESTTELFERADRACVQSRELVQEGADLLVAAKANAGALQRRIDADRELP